MKLIHLSIATAVAALAGGAAYAQQPQPAAAPTPGSVTGDWNGAHSPPDDKQYQDKVRVPLGTPAATAEAPPAEPATVSATSAEPPAAPAATTETTNASATTFTSMTVTNGPVPDTKENRAKYGQPMSRAGKRTAAAGN
jgi:hypothetical protein